MKTAYLNPYGQSAYEIIHKYGNITQITTKTQEINNIIKNTPNQKHKQINTIKDLCHDKIRQHLQEQHRQKSNKYNYLYNRAIDTMDTIATHTTTSNSNKLRTRKQRSRPHNTNYNKHHTQKNRNNNRTRN